MWSVGIAKILGRAGTVAQGSEGEESGGVAGEGVLGGETIRNDDIRDSNASHSDLTWSGVAITRLRRSRHVVCIAWSRQPYLSLSFLSVANDAPRFSICFVRSSRPILESVSSKSCQTRLKGLLSFLDHIPTKLTSLVPAIKAVPAAPQLSHPTDADRGLLPTMHRWLTRLSTAVPRSLSKQRMDGSGQGTHKPTGQGSLGSGRQAAESSSQTLALQFMPLLLPGVESFPGVE